MEFTPLFCGDSLDGWNIVPRGIRLVEQGPLGRKCRLQMAHMRIRGI